MPLADHLVARPLQNKADCRFGVHPLRKGRLWVRVPPAVHAAVAQMAERLKPLGQNFVGLVSNERKSRGPHGRPL